MMHQVTASLSTLEKDRKFQFIILALITFLAAALRFYKLGQWSFWIDELYTLIDSLAILQRWWAATLSILLSSLTINLLGEGEWQARLAPALIGVISAPILYFPVRRLTNTYVALLASLLLAISPWHLYWSQNARFYPLMFLAYTLGLLLFFRALEEDNGRLAASGAFFLMLAIGERTSAFLFLPVLAAYLGALFIFRLPKPAGLRVGILAWLLLPIAYYALPEVYIILFGESVTSIEQVTTERDVARSGLEVIWTLFIGNPGVSPQWLVNSIVESISIPIFILALFSGLTLVWRRDRFGLFLVTGAVVPTMLMVLLSFFSYVLDRYVFITLFFWILLAAIGVQRLFMTDSVEGRIMATGVLMLLVASAMAQNVYYFKYELGARSNWKAALAYVEQQRHSVAEPVFIGYPEMAQYYLGKEENVYHIDEILTMDMDEVRERAWFVDSGWLAPESAQWLRENARLMAVYDVHTTIETLPMRVFLYDPSLP